MTDSTNEDGVIIEDISRAQATIQTEHMRIHNGEMFAAGHLWTEGAAIADNANAELLIQLSDAAHFIMNVAAGGDAEIHFFENPTFSAAGTAVTAHNKNGYSSSTSTATITHGPTITGDGISLGSSLMPGGAGGNAQGGTDSGFAHEWILKTGNDYLVRVINRAGITKAISINISFYTPT